jgi:hypothetical protein
MKNPLTLLDVIEVAKSIKKVVTPEMIKEVLKRYPSAQDNDQSATWNLVIEQLIYEVYYEFGKLERKKEELINEVIEQMKYDISVNDVTAIDELLRYIPIENLNGYLAKD